MPSAHRLVEHLRRRCVVVGRASALTLSSRSARRTAGCGRPCRLALPGNPSLLAWAPTSTPLLASSHPSRLTELHREPAIDLPEFAQRQEPRIALRALVTADVRLVDAGELGHRRLREPFCFRARASSRASLSAARTPSRCSTASGPRLAAFFSTPCQNCSKVGTARRGVAIVEMLCAKTHGVKVSMAARSESSSVSQR